MSRILFLAPQPFYQERGTPIAIDLALRALEKDGYEIDLVTYPEGEPRDYANVRHFRVFRVPGVDGVGPGFSWKKLVYSFLMIFTATRLAFTGSYRIVHAVEEACFIAWFLKLVKGLPYVYDMDSSIAQQLLNKKTRLHIFSGLFSRLEAFAVRNAAAVVAVCPALVDMAREYGARRILLLQDISLLDRYRPGDGITDLRGEIGAESPLLLYVGNLEKYQGIDLLLEGFALAMNQGTDAVLAVIGGRSEDIDFYQRKAARLGLSDRVFFFGPRPVADLGAYLAQADILVSPRAAGNNTPMKVYTYLDSGKALLATRIGSHTQVLNDETACLVEPTPEGMAAGIRQLAGSGELRKRLGDAGRKLAAEKHSWPVFESTLQRFYREITG